MKCRSKQQSAVEFFDNRNKMRYSYAIIYPNRKIMQNKNVARDVGDADAFSQVGSMFNLDELRIISSMKSIVDDASEPIWLRIREQFAE